MNNINNTEDNEVYIPIIDEALIKWLKTIFPDKLPNLNQGQRIDDFGLGFLYGNREVIQRLEAEYESQQEELLNSLQE